MIQKKVNKMIEPLETILQSIWFILPAYIANGAPVVLGGGPPIDMGKKLSDGKRILGDGKTIRGFIAGIVAGTIFGAIQIAFGNRTGGITIILLLSLGALLGDMVGSFLKRRIGLSRGKAAPGLDQLEFLAGALILSSLIKTPSWEIILTLIIITPAIHLGTNFIGYKMGYKSEPY